MGEVPEQLKKHVFKKGNKLGGRKKGSSLKEYAKKYLASMTDEERNEYLNSINPDIIWKMSEGNPHQSTDGTLEVTLPKPILDVPEHNSNQEDNPTEQED